MMRPAVFLDRDGTLIEHVHHLVNAADVRLIPGAAEALCRLHDAGYTCIIVTNQSVVGRGMLTHEGLRRVHDRMSQLLAACGAAVDGLYYCPEVPCGDDPMQSGHPDRKPAPGMLLRAAKEHDVNLAASWMVGDSVSDLAAGSNAGCRGSILVRTGCGMTVAADHPAVRHVAADVLEAADILMELDRKSLVLDGRHR